MNVKKLISLVLSFILSLFIVVVCILLIVKVTFLNEGYLREQITKSQYTENLINEINKTFISYGIVSGFDEKFFTSVLTVDRVKSDIYYDVGRLYSGSTKKVDTKSFSDHLYNLLIENVKKRGFELNDEVDTALIYLTDTCTQTYKDNVGIPYVTQAHTYIAKFNKVIDLAIGGMLALCVFTMIILYMINPWKRRKIRYYMYAVGGSFFMLLMPSLFVLYANKIDKIGISGKSLYFLVVSYLNNVVNMLLSFTVGLGVIWLMLWAWRMWICSHDGISEKRRKYDEA
jgi:hypothetical protein